MSAESDAMFAEYRQFRRRFNENLGRPAVLPEVEVVYTEPETVEPVEQPSKVIPFSNYREVA